jgi:hypothetical protein
MTVDEFNTALTDLETRVDRLRALYENWFRGYEKLEPGVARKDVERRVYGLRKELPRNTALRFRYHQLYQRYTTLATYWQRTARQIEEGTYRRQLQRINRRRNEEEARTLAPPRPDEESSTASPAFELNLDETLDVRSLLDDFDLDQVASALEGSLPQSSVPAKATGELAAHVRAAGRMSVPNVASLGPVAAASPPDAAPRTVGRFARPSANAGASAPGVAAPPPMAPANDVTPSKPDAKPPALPPAGRGTGTVPMPPAPSRGTGTVPMPPPPSSGRGTGTVPLPPIPSAARAGTGNVPMPLAPAKAPPPPSVAAKPAVPPMARPTPPSVAKPSLPATPRPAQPTASAPAARPAVTPPPAARQPQPSGPVPIARVDGLDDGRMRRIYEEYAAAKRKNNEGEVRFETLAGSISKMMPDLSKKHAGKQIDFEVVLKDGRVGLKPKAT